MKLRLTSLLFLFAVSAHAEPDAPKPDAPKNPKHRLQEGDDERDMTRGHEFLKKFDLNHDKKLTKDEFGQLPRISQLPTDKQDKLFARFDKNQNGTLEVNELPALGGPEQGPNEGRRRPFPHLAEMDKDGDKKIDFAEFILSPMIAKLPPERQKKIFQNMDRNQDNFITPADGPPPGNPNRQGPGKQNGRNGPNGPNGPESDDRKPRPQGPPLARGFGAIDLNHDKVIDFPEFQKAPFAQGKNEDEQEDLFEAMDTNKDIKVDEKELKQHWERNKAKPKGTGDTPKRPDKKTPPAAADDEMMMEGA